MSCNCNNYTRGAFDLSFYIMCFIWGWTMVSLVLHEFEIKKFKKEAIQHGYAQYNPTSSVWEWRSTNDVCNVRKW